MLGWSSRDSYPHEAVEQLLQRGELREALKKGWFGDEWAYRVVRAYGLPRLRVAVEAGADLGLDLRNHDGVATVGAIASSGAIASDGQWLARILLPCLVEKAVALSPSIYERELTPALLGRALTGLRADEDTRTSTSWRSCAASCDAGAGLSTPRAATAALILVAVELFFFPLFCSYLPEVSSNLRLY